MQLPNGRMYGRRPCPVKVFPGARGRVKYCMNSQLCDRFAIAQISNLILDSNRKLEGTTLMSG